ncbi:hypothetical protein HYC85_024991 [Camellia sinensis]|uniref:Uncharacterized protein n=1 Tax=Camellia sinensis TaxID=4442 RepID=A0A7J7GB14_CAMSI|nr:hypothetical protein HYC85_024991 [Camellia sinensis]
MAIDEARVSVPPENLGLGQDELVGFSKEGGSSSNPNSVNMGGEVIDSQGSASTFNLLQFRWSDIVEIDGGEEAVIDRFKDLPNSLVGVRARNLVSKLNQQPNENSSDKIGGKSDLSAEIPRAFGAQSSRGQQSEGRSGFSATNRGGRGGRGQGPYLGGPNEFSAVVGDGTTPNLLKRARRGGGQVDCGVQEVLVSGLLSEIEITTLIEVNDVVRQHGGQVVCEVPEVPVTGTSSEIVKAGSEEPESTVDPSEPDPKIQANSLILEEEVGDRVMLTPRMLRSAVKPAVPKATGSSCSRRKKKRVCKPFKFFNMWADHPDFIPVVRGVWCKYVKGSPLFRICSKLRSLKPELKALNKKHFSDISARTSCAKEDLDRV